MKTQYIDFQTYKDQGTIAILSFDRPEKLNAIHFDVLTELRNHLYRIKNSPDLDAVLIKSLVKKAFCAGIDTSYVKSLSNKEAANFFGALAETLELIQDLPCPTIAAVNGYAFGAGADIALACDVRVGDQTTRFRFPGPQFGLILGTQRLIDEVGLSIARWIALTNPLIQADRALQSGLLHEIAEEECCFEAALALTNKMEPVPHSMINRIRNMPHSDEVTPIEHTRNSVQEGDFQERFSRYISTQKNRKKDGG